MVTKRRITEYLDIDLDNEMWCCNRCGKELISVRENYKKGCLVSDRNPKEIWRPLTSDEEHMMPDPDWQRVVEFYCPVCGTMIENEVLPPGHPITHDIELNIEKLKAKYLSK